MRVLVMMAGVLLAQAAWAQAVCMPTPVVAASNYPGARNIVPSNDLTMPAGKAVAATGQKLVVQGRLLDKACIPLQGVVVEMWQANPYGAWRLASAEDRANPNPVFSGAGRTVTDNEGNFHFITLFPGSGKNQAPKLYFRVVGASAFSTTFFFENEDRNAQDAQFKRLKPDAQQAVILRMQPISADTQAGYMGIAQIVLPTKARYRSY